MAKRTPNEITKRLDKIAATLGGGDSTDGMVLLLISEFFDKFPKMTITDLEKLAE